MKFKLSYTKILSISNKAKLGLYIILLIVLGFISIRVGVINLLKDNNWRNPAILFSMISFVLGMLYVKLLKMFLKWQDKFQDKTEELIRRADLGDDGEKTLFTWAREIFSGHDYRLFPNFIIPGKDFDIDLIVIGHKGIFIFEVKKSANPIIFSNSGVFLMNDDQNPIAPLPFNPLNELEKHESALINYLKSNQFEDVKIHSCLIILGSKIKFIDKPKFFIAHDKKGVNEYIDFFTDDLRYTDKFCNDLSSLLSNEK
ncbi:MAG: NERD domain-containing protein [Patescibacteria group bacterium]|nr:NERD domain-containing protein [Patescibacteria group bacterium]